MSDRNMPNIFRLLLSDMSIDKTDIAGTSDGFYMVHKSISSILATKSIFDFPDSSGERLACDKFFDDWFLYAVPNDNDYTYSLLKLREQEHDTEDGSPADGDAPGVTISFIAFDTERLLNCLADPSDENRKKLNAEINRVVAYRGQRHHKALKRYFKNPESKGAYLVADRYVKTIASYASAGKLEVPDFYKEIVQQSISYKTSAKLARLPRFVEALNKAAWRVVCDNEYIYLEDRDELTEQEALAILATHTGNTSFYSFAAEVEYHARFLTPLAKIKIPFFGRSIYDSAIRADMTVQDPESQGTAPFYKETSKIVKRQKSLHNWHTIIDGKEENNIMRKLLSALLLAGMFLCMLTGCGSTVPRPEVKEGEFDVTITYEVNGEVKTLDLVYVCEYDRVAWTLEGTRYRAWNGNFVGYDDGEVIPVLETEGGKVALCVLIYPEYFMGEPDYIDDFAPVVLTNYVYYEDGNEMIIDDQELIAEEYGVKVIGCEYSKPIKNSFN